MRRILSIFLGIVILIFASVSLYNTINKYKERKQEIASLEGELKKLEQTNNELLEQLLTVKSSSFVEKEAREKLNFKKEGEQVLIIKEKKNSFTEDTSQEDNTAQRSSNLNRWWQYFFGG